MVRCGFSDFGVTRMALMGLVFAGVCWPCTCAMAQTVEILSKISLLPEPVKNMRRQILDAAVSGDLQELQSVLDSNEMKPVVTYNGDAAPLAYWKSISTDGEGREILAIITEILTSRFAKTTRKSGQTIYIWPYFAEIALTDLKPHQKVELFRLVPPERVETMSNSGKYTHYRLGIGDDGTWHYFLNGQ